MFVIVSSRGKNRTAQLSIVIVYLIFWWREFPVCYRIAARQKSRRAATEPLVYKKMGGDTPPAANAAPPPTKKKQIDAFDGIT